MSRRARPIAALALVLVACTTAAARPGTCRTPRTTADFAAPGAFGVGRTTWTLVDTTRATPAHGDFPGAPTRTLVTEVWWPEGRTEKRPLVVLAHGFLDSRLGEAYLATHLASRGYVVVAPDFPLSRGGAPGGATLTDIQNQPGDVRFVIDQVFAHADTAGDPLAGRVDRRRVGMTGLSLGGLTTLLTTYHRALRDPRIHAALPIAAPSCFFTPRFFRTSRAPLLLLHGADDLLVPYAANAAAAFVASHQPHLLVTLAGATHTGFSGLVSALPSSTRYDADLGCPALLGAAGQELSPTGPSPFEALATRRAGVSTDRSRCPQPCLADSIAEAQVGMSAARQHDVTRAVAAAFFDAWLVKDKTARCFLDRTLATENPDTTVQVR